MHFSNDEPARRTGAAVHTCIGKFSRIWHFPADHFVHAESVSSYIRTTDSMQQKDFLNNAA
jgi:hypothetical protein